MFEYQLTNSPNWTVCSWLSKERILEMSWKQEPAPGFYVKVQDLSRAAPSPPLVQVQIQSWALSRSIVVRKAKFVLKR